MTPTSKRLTQFALVVAVSAAAAAVTPARAEYRCNAPKTLFDQRACATAKQGPNELRRYIQRIRALDQLYFFDYANERDFARWAAESHFDPAPPTQNVATAQPASGR